MLEFSLKHVERQCASCPQQSGFPPCFQSHTVVKQTVWKNPLPCGHSSYPPCVALLPQFLLPVPTPCLPPECLKRTSAWIAQRAAMLGSLCPLEELLAFCLALQHWWASPGPRLHRGLTESSIGSVLLGLSCFTQDHVQQGEGNQAFILMSEQPPKARPMHQCDGHARVVRVLPHLNPCIFIFLVPQSIFAQWEPSEVLLSPFKFLVFVFHVKCFITIILHVDEFGQIYTCM